MVGRSKRKIVTIGNSRGVTLPPEWLREKNPQEVHIIYDNLLLITDDKDTAERFCERFIEKMIDEKMTVKKEVG